VQIVVTSINHPSVQLSAGLAAASAHGWQLVVVGDLKTPRNWSLDGVVFLGVNEQARLGFEIHDLLPTGPTPARTSATSTPYRYAEL